MKAKEYLRQIAYIDNYVESLIEEIQRWQDKATSINAKIPTTKSWNSDRGMYEDVVIERVSGGMPSDRVGEAVAEYVDLQREDLNKLFQKRNEIIARLRQLEDQNHYNVLYKRYVQHKDYFEIANEMDNSYSGITTLHGRALKAFQKILEGANEGKS